MARAIAKLDPKDLNLPGGISLGAVGVEITGKPTLTEWQMAMQFIDRCASASMWWHGDMLNYGYATYGELASQEDGDGKYSSETLYKAKYVSEHVPICIRMQNLSWAHHQAVAPLPIEEQTKWLAEASDSALPLADFRKSLRNDRLRIAAEQQVPAGKYRVIYADPPWSYNDQRMGTKEGGGAVAQYPLMETPAICELPIEGLALDNSVLFVWATSPLLPDAMQVIEAWGFTYKASFVWDKQRGFNGHYNDVKHELLLVAIRGSCQPECDKIPPSVISEKKTRHSAKPHTFREIIAQLYPTGPRIELFAREAPKGWDVWGNEAI